MSRSRSNSHSRKLSNENAIVIIYLKALVKDQFPSYKKFKGSGLTRLYGTINGVYYAAVWKPSISELIKKLVKKYDLELIFHTAPKEWTKSDIKNSRSSTAKLLKTLTTHAKFGKLARHFYPIEKAYVLSMRQRSKSRGKSPYTWKSVRVKGSTSLMKRVKVPRKSRSRSLRRSKSN